MTVTVIAIGAVRCRRVKGWSFDPPSTRRVALECSGCREAVLPMRPIQGRVGRFDQALFASCRACTAWHDAAWNVETCAASPARPRGQLFIGTADTARVMPGAIDACPEREGVALKPTQHVDAPAMMLSLAASTRALTLIPRDIGQLLRASAVSRPLADPAPSIALGDGFSRADALPLLARLLSRFAARREPLQRSADK